MPAGEAGRYNQRMLSVEERERIRREYYDAQKSRRKIERELGHDRRTINKALEDAVPKRYERTAPRAKPRLGDWEARIDALWAERATQPRKQRYTAQRIYALIQAEGYGGSPGSVRRYVRLKHKAAQRPEVFLRLDYDPGMDVQVDWGQAEVILGGEPETAQFLQMRACYSRKVFVRAYPTQKQESFLDALASGFEFFGGVFRTAWFDNLKTAVQTVLQGKTRREQRQFVAFRSHYLFEAVFCTPGQGHEKGGVENGIGYAQRTLFSPLPVARDFEDLNAQLLAACQASDARQVAGQRDSIAQAWQEERDCLKPLPKYRFPCCASAELTLDGYGLITFETNRYSVPVERTRKLLTVQAYPFTLDILNGETAEIIATHPRSYGQAQEVIDPVHFLPLLEQRTAAFEHSRAMRQLRADLPPVFEELLARLRRDEGLGVREFVRVLRLLEAHPTDRLEAAVSTALMLRTVNRDAIELLLRAQDQPETLTPPLDPAAWPKQAAWIPAPSPSAPDVQLYDALLTRLSTDGALLAPAGAA